MGKEVKLTGENYEKARNLLLMVIDLLNKNDVVYHLEGGTLLGIVRDGDLLPWDHDLDISIPSSQVDKFNKCIGKVSNFSWRIRSKYKFYNQHPAWNKSSQRLYKIKNRKFFFFSGRLHFDVFVKYEHEGYVYWEAKKKIMRVDKKHYTSYEEISYRGRMLKVPNDYKGYLTAKYGDWSVPVKEWDCSEHELTIVKP